jgi:hypothetical protein
LDAIDASQPGTDTSTVPPEAQDDDDATGSRAATETAAIPIPRPKPEGIVAVTPPAPETVAPETTIADVALDLKPGSVIRGSKGLIPIPAPKPRIP